MSGIADPRVIGELLEEAGIAESFRLVNVISLVDPGSLGELLRTLPISASRWRHHPMSF